MRSASSYWIVISLAVCDLFMIVISLIHIIPATYLHEKYVEIQHMRTIWAMFAYNVFWYTGVVQLAAMAVNRFVSIVYPLQYKRVFAPRNTLLIIFSLYLLGLLSSLPTLHECCYIVYDHHSYVTYYWPEIDSNYMWLDILLNTLSVLTMILCYAAILVRVRKSSMTRRKHQMVALAAKARRSSGAALLGTSASVGHSTTATVDSASTAIALNPAATVTTETNLAIPNGSVGNASHGQRLLNHHESTLPLPASSSLSALGKNHNNNSQSHNNNSCVPTKQSVSRTSSASPVMARARFFLTASNEPPVQESEPDGGASQQLLSPKPQMPVPSRLRRQAGSAHTRHTHSQSHRHQHQQPQQASRREIRLFVQFFVVSLVFLSTWVTWQWLPRIPDASKWIYFATTTFFFINNAVNPTVYLIFNSGLRHQVKALFFANHVSKCDAAKAAAAAAAAMGGNQVATRYNSSSSGSNPNNQQGKTNRKLGKRQSAQEDYSAADEASEELRSSSNLALAAATKGRSSVASSRDYNEQMQSWNGQEV